MSGATQQFLELNEIKEGVVVLKDKTLRGIIMISSINFALKSEQEQQSIIFQFQNFLNTLDFPLEIIMQSKKLNISNYLDKLNQMREAEENQLLKVQIREYGNFIRKIISGGSIMSKNFYATIPFNFGELKSVSTQKKQKEENAEAIKEERFQRAKVQLMQRMRFAASGLRRCGLKSIALNTTELIGLFWALYHPEKSEVGYYPNIPSELIKYAPSPRTASDIKNLNLLLENSL